MHDELPEIQEVHSQDLTMTKTRKKAQTLMSLRAKVEAREKEERQNAQFLKERYSTSSTNLAAELKEIIKNFCPSHCQSLFAPSDNKNIELGHENSVYISRYDDPTPPTSSSPSLTKKGLSLLHLFRTKNLKIKQPSTNPPKALGSLIK